MSKNIALKTVSVAFAIALIVSVAFISCSEVPTVPPPDADTFEPATDELGDAVLDKRYAEYLENSSLAFINNSPASEDSFSYDKTDDGIKITKYIGKDEIVVVPQSIEGLDVTVIGSEAFSGGSLRAVYVPDSVKVIENGAFVECSGLSTLRLPFVGDGKDNAFLGYVFGAKISGENVVKVPPSLDMVIIGGEVSEIADEAFVGCKTLSAVVLPNSVTSIGNLAFYECADLCFVSLGTGVKSIGEYAFAYCSSLYYIDCSMADSVATGAFLYCAKLNGIKLSFSDGDYLGRWFGAVTPDHNKNFVPDSLRRVEVAEDCKKIPDRAFTECYYIMSVYLPQTLESVGVRAFYSCRSLRKIDIPDSTKIIDDDAFFKCDSLAEVTLGNSLESLGMQAFYECASLNNIRLPESLEEIKPSTFYGCVSLSEVELGGVKKIGKNAFYGCDELIPVPLDGVKVESGNDAIKEGK